MGAASLRFAADLGRPPQVRRRLAAALPTATAAPGELPVRRTAATAQVGVPRWWRPEPPAASLAELADTSAHPPRALRRIVSPVPTREAPGGTAAAVAPRQVPVRRLDAVRAAGGMLLSRDLAPLRPPTPTAGASGGPATSPPSAPGAGASSAGAGATSSAPLPSSGPGGSGLPGGGAGGPTASLSAAASGAPSAAPSASPAPRLGPALTVRRRAAVSAAARARADLLVHPGLSPVARVRSGELPSSPVRRMVHARLSPALAAQPVTGSVTVPHPRALIAAGAAAGHGALPAVVSRPTPSPVAAVRRRATAITPALAAHRLAPAPGPGAARLAQPERLAGSQQAEQEAEATQAVLRRSPSTSAGSAAHGSTPARSAAHAGAAPVLAVADTSTDAGVPASVLPTPVAGTAVPAAAGTAAASTAAATTAAGSTTAAITPAASTAATPTGPTTTAGPTAAGAGSTAGSERGSARAGGTSAPERAEAPQASRIGRPGSLAAVLRRRTGDGASAAPPARTAPRGMADDPALPGGGPLRRALAESSALVPGPAARLGSVAPAGAPAAAAVAASRALTGARPTGSLQAATVQAATVRGATVQAAPVQAATVQPATAVRPSPAAAATPATPAPAAGGAEASPQGRRALLRRWTVRAAGRAGAPAAAPQPSAPAWSTASTPAASSSARRAGGATSLAASAPLLAHHRSARALAPTDVPVRRSWAGRVRPHLAGAAGAAGAVGAVGVAARSQTGVPLRPSSAPAAAALRRSVGENGPAAAAAGHAGADDHTADVPMVQRARLTTGLSSGADLVPATRIGVPASGPARVLRRAVLVPGAGRAGGAGAPDGSRDEAQSSAPAAPAALLLPPPAGAAGPRGAAATGGASPSARGVAGAHPAELAATAGAAAPSGLPAVRPVAVPVRRSPTLPGVASPAAAGSAVAGPAGLAP
ncbi:MAG: hypothetical protein ACTHQ3_04160, partial [Motilibacteraceae bacterium]